MPAQARAPRGPGCGPSPRVTPRTPRAPRKSRRETLRRSSIFRIRCTVRGDLRLVPIAYREQHFLRIDEVAALLAVIFENPRLDDRVDRTALFAKAAEDAFGEIDVIARRSPRAVVTLLRLDRDRERRTHRFAQLAGDATLLAVRIAAQRRHSAKPRAHRRLLFRKLHGDLAREHVATGQHQSPAELEQEPGVEEPFD